MLDISNHTAPRMVTNIFSGAMVNVVFSPTEPLLAFGGEDDFTPTSARWSVHFWTVGTNLCPAGVALSGPCTRLAFSRDGRTLLTATMDPQWAKGDTNGQITLWSIPGGTPITRFTLSIPYPKYGDEYVAVDADLKLAAISGPTLQVIDLTTGRLRWRVKSDYGEFDGDAVFSQDRSVLMTAEGFESSRLRLWDVQSGTQIGPGLTGHRHLVDEMLLWPDGGKAASASKDGTIRLWDVHDPTHACALGRALRGPSGSTHALALLPDGKTLLSAGRDGSVYAWDTTRVRQESSRMRLPEAVDLSWQFAPDSQSVVSLDRRGRVSRWLAPDFQAKQVLLNVGTNFGAARLSTDAHLLALNFWDASIQVWDLARGGPPRQLPCVGQFLARGFSRDGNRFFFWDASKEVFHLWDLNAFREVRSWAVPKAVVSDAWWINAAVVSPGEKWGLAVSSDGKAFLQDIAQDRSTHWDLGVNDVQDVDFCPTGDLFAVGSGDGYVQIWNASSQRLLATVLNQLPMYSVSFSPDASRLITTRAGAKAVTLWDMETHRELLALEAESAFYQSAQFSSDGCLLGCRDVEGTLYVWRAPSWAEIETTEKTKPNVK